MTNLELGSDINRLIVDGILQGYKDYLEVRRSAVKKYDLKVSGAYAWIKGNHIDSSVNKNCTGSLITSDIEIAGTSWEYLRFNIKKSAQTYMLIVKNSRIKNTAFNGKIDESKKNNYLFEYAGINNEVKKDIENGEILTTERSIQLELPGFEEYVDKSTIENAINEYSRFYVVTYELNEEKNISRIALCMPDQATMTLHELDNLTPLIASSRIKIDTNELEIAQTDLFPEGEYPNELNTFGYKTSKKNQEILPADK